MFNKKYEERLSVWSSFRDSLEESNDPLQDVIDFYQQAPYVSMHTDPYDKNAWPSAWELLDENRYCDFCRVLAYYYSLQLTERFKDSKFEIHINTTKDQTFYTLIVDDMVLGYKENKAVDLKEIPLEFKSQVVHVMTKGQ